MNINMIPKEKLEELKSYPIHIRLQMLRGWSGCTQSEFADLLGISKTTVSQWECGYFCPSSKSLMKIVQVFDLPCDLFFNMENSSNA